LGTADQTNDQWRKAVVFNSAIRQNFIHGIRKLVAQHGANGKLALKFEINFHCF
jgi:hypothetical protein